MSTKRWCHEFPNSKLLFQSNACLGFNLHKTKSVRSVLTRWLGASFLVGKHFLGDFFCVDFAITIVAEILQGIASSAHLKPTLHCVGDVNAQKTWFGLYPYVLCLQLALGRRCNRNKFASKQGWGVARSWSRTLKNTTSRIFLSDSGSPIESFLHRAPKLRVPTRADKIVQFLLKLLLKQRIFPVHHHFHWLQQIWLQYLQLEESSIIG